METITLKINNQEIVSQTGLTILEAAERNGIDIPTLCYLKDINKTGSCRICLCEVKGEQALLASCVTPIEHGMEVWTNSDRVVESRRKTLELLISNHRFDCTECERGGDCELQSLCQEYGVDEKQFGSLKKETEVDKSTSHLIRDNSRCIQCRRCIAVCKNLQNVGAINANGRGIDTHIGDALPLADTACVHCGMCIAYCPVGALLEKDDTFEVWKAITNKKKYVVAAVSPTVAIQIGECFGDPVGYDYSGRLVAILRRIGFDKVFNVDSMAWATVIAEREEIENRKAEGRLPLISAMCPSWVKSCELLYPEWKEHLSTVKSVQSSFGELCKSMYAKEMGLSKEDVFVVSFETCTAGKTFYKENTDVDVALTPNEATAMIKRACVSSFTALSVWSELPSEEYDLFPGAREGRVLGDNGGLLEAVCAAKLKAIQVSGLAEADKLLRSMKEDTSAYEYIEILACPGGCLNGGGQAHQRGNVHSFTDLNSDRAKGFQSKNVISPLKLTVIEV